MDNLAHLVEELSGRYFLNNELVELSDTQKISVFNPKDESLVTDRLPICGPNEVNAAVDAARRALKGPWSTFTGHMRGRCLLKLADLMEEHAKEIAYLECLCSGRVISRVLPEMASLARIVRYYGGWADKLEGESFVDDDGFYKIVQREPLGVCCGITPYNGAIVVFCFKVAPALATGNTFILKPPEKSPFSSLFMAGLVKEASFPDGVLNLVLGEGMTGSLLSSHMEIDMISFTGSVPTGKKIAAAANASNMKRVTLELGGKSPALVFGDANLAIATKWLSIGLTMNAGQVCVAPSRIYVAEEIADSLVEGIKNYYENIAQKIGGDPLDIDTTFGPVIDKAQKYRIYRFIEQGKAEATLVTGGQPYDGTGHYVHPTIFLNPTKEASIIKEEIFGPVLTITTFKTEEEAVKLANDTEFGLAGYVFTENVNRILRVSKQLQAGIIGVNAVNNLPFMAPFGGYKQSGVGKELGKYALDAYTNTKTIYINTTGV